MVDATTTFETLKDRQLTEAAKLSAQAGKAATHALSPRTIGAAVAAVAEAAPDRGRGGLGEPAADLAAIHQDQAFAGSLVKDLRVAEEQARLFILGALATGYKSQVEGTKLNGARLVYTPDAESAEALAGYPILGETAADHARAIAEALRRDVMRAVGMPLTGQLPVERVAESLTRASMSHAGRVEAGVAESYFAGVQAGLIDSAKALVK